MEQSAYWSLSVSCLVVLGASCTVSRAAPRHAPPARNAPAPLPTTAGPVNSALANTGTAVEPRAPTDQPLLLALGATHSCASVLAGVFCWGDNRRGQAGGTNTPRVLAPFRVLSHPVFELAAGSEHTCGDAECWGRNSEGQLADGTRMDRSLPALASDLFKTSAEFLGDEQATQSAQPWRWLLSAEGSWATRAAEDGFESRRAGHISVLGLPCSGGSSDCGWLVSAASFDNTVCALLRGYGGAAQLKCSENQAVLELAPAEDDSGPRLGGFEQVALGHRFACAARRDQRIECWGDLSGLRGDGNRRRSTWISGYWSARSVFTGYSYGCFVRADERVLCFGTEPAMGLNHAGFWPGTEPHALSIDALGTPLRAQVLATGPHHACALSVAGARCWGENNQGQLGDGSTLNALQPVKVQLAMAASTGTVVLSAAAKSRP